MSARVTRDVADAGDQISEASTATCTPSKRQPDYRHYLKYLFHYKPSALLAQRMSKSASPYLDQAKQPIYSLYARSGKNDPYTILKFCERRVICFNGIFSDPVTLRL